MRGAVTRRRIWRHIQEHPGATRSQLCKALDVKPQVLDEHVQHLERRHRIHARGGRSRRLYPGSDERRFLVHLNGDLSLVILDRVQAEPGSRAGELARSLDLSRSLVRRHLRTLDEQGAIGRSGTWRRRYHANGRHHRQSTHAHVAARPGSN